jgi:hypothetical protein
MTHDDAEWNRLERSNLKWWARCQVMKDVIVRLKTGDCWCGRGVEPEMFSGHSSACMEAQKMMEAYK